MSDWQMNWSITFWRSVWRNLVSCSNKFTKLIKWPWNTSRLLFLCVFNYILSKTNTSTVHAIVATVLFKIDFTNRTLLWCTLFKNPDSDFKINFDMHWAKFSISRKLGSNVIIISIVILYLTKTNRWKILDNFYGTVYKL